MYVNEPVTYRFPTRIWPTGRFITSAVAPSEGLTGIIELRVRFRVMLVLIG